MEEKNMDIVYELQTKPPPGKLKQHSIAALLIRKGRRPIQLYILSFVNLLCHVSFVFFLNKVLIAVCHFSVI